MKINTCLRISALILLALSSTSCSTLTDSIAASSQTFTNTTKATTEVSSSKSSSKSAKLQQAVEFAAINWMQLAANMANGQGEHLQTLADLLEVSAAQKSAFYAATKNHYQQLLPNVNTTPAQLIQHLQVEISHLNKA